MSEKLKLERIRNEANAALYKIEETERDERNARLVGKCLRYKNSYGHGEDWVLYAKVVGAAAGNLIVHRFETTCRGEIKIDPEFVERHLSEGWKQIPSEEFADAWLTLRRRICDINLYKSR